MFGFNKTPESRPDQIEAASAPTPPLKKEEEHGQIGYLQTRQVSTQVGPEARGAWGKGKQLAGRILSGFFEADSGGTALKVLGKILEGPLTCIMASAFTCIGLFTGQERMKEDLERAETIHSENSTAAGGGATSQSSRSPTEAPFRENSSAGIAEGPPDKDHATMFRAVDTLPEEQRADIIKLFLRLPQAKQDEASLNDCINLLRGIRLEYLRGEIISVVSSLPEEQRADIIAARAPLLEGVTTGYSKLQIIQAVASLPEEQRADIIKKAAPLLKGVTSVDHKIETIRFMASLTKEQRASIFLEKVFKKSIKKFKAKSLKKLFKSESQEPPVIHAENSAVAGGGAASRSSQSENVSLNIREPIVSLQKKQFSSSNTPIEEALRKIETEAKLVTYERFVGALHRSFSDTLASIQTAPPEKRKYVVLSGKRGKSTNWVISHLRNEMLAFPPSAIITKAQLKQYLEDNPDISHVVMIDDGAYSGEQASTYIGDLSPNSELQFHITIPYMTPYAKNKISNAGKKRSFQMHFHDQELMLSYGQLIDAGIFSFTGEKILKDKDSILQLDTSSLPEHIKTNLDSIKEHLTQGHSDEQIVNEILETIEMISKQVDDDRTFSQDGVALIRKLYQSIGLKRDEQQHQDLLRAYYTTLTSHYTINKEQIESRTPTWMAHKGADGASTDESHMRMIVGGDRPIEPYKGNTDQRMQLITSLKREMGERTLENFVKNNEELRWLEGRLDFVESNRGLFFIGNNYYDETNPGPSVTIKRSAEEIELGGPSGVFQIKLQEGDQFQVKDNEGHEVTLRINAQRSLEIVNDEQ